MQIRDAEGDPTPAGLATAGTVVVVVATGGAAAAPEGSLWITPIIALIGAIFVATLTAVTTNRRQAKQLAEERARQAKQLAEERARQAKELEEQLARLKLQLAHARDLGELAHLREIFDEAATLFEARRAAIDKYAEAVRSRKSDADDETVQVAERSAADASQKMSVFWRRLALRLPLDHVVSQTYHLTDQALDDRAIGIGAMAERGLFEEMVAYEDMIAVGDAWKEWVDAARAELESRAAAAA